MQIFFSHQNPGNNQRTDHAATTSFVNPRNPHAQTRLKKAYGAIVSYKTLAMGFLFERIIVGLRQAFKKLPAITGARYVVKRL